MGYYNDIHFKSFAPTGSQVATVSHASSYTLPPTLISCGIFARTTAVGVEIQAVYDGAAYFVPPGTWAAMAASVGVGNEIVFGSALNGNDFQVRYTSGQASGAVARIDLAYKSSAKGPATYEPIGHINVYFDPVTAQHETWFSVRATSSNVSGGMLTLNHSRLNGRSDMEVFVTQSGSPVSGAAAVLNDNTISVFYDTGLARWRIRNNTGSSGIPLNSVYNIRIEPFADTLTSPTSNSGLTYSNQISNSNQHAIVFAMAASANIDRPYHVYYQPVQQVWKVGYSDGTPLPAGSKFFVRAFGWAKYHSEYAGVVGSNNTNGLGVDLAGRPGGMGSARTTGAVRTLPSWTWFDQLAAPAIVMPSGTGNSTNLSIPFLHKFYLRFVSGTWQIVSFSSGSVFRSRAAFNVWSMREDDPQWPPALL
ncbi:MAG: hypothetical protein KBG28_21220 [Kofleriaceae bacterium]|nr:hypothetical protein [Kofleriaceae bacterium]